MPHVKLTARDVLDALRRRHGCETGNGKWSVVEEAFCGWNSSGGGIDLFAIAAWQSARVPGLAPSPRGETHVPTPQHHVIAYEVKVSRSDYRREVNGTGPSRTHPYGKAGWPSKASHALARSHHYFFAVPKGLLTDEEIDRPFPVPGDRGPLWLPPEAGLLEVGPKGGVTVKRPAPRRAARALTVGEVAEIIRHALTPASLRTAIEEAHSWEKEIARQRELRDRDAATIVDLEAEIERLRERLTDVY